MAGLSSPFASINFSTLGLLGKALSNESDADIIAGRPEVVAALIRLWLCTPEIGVSDSAQKVLLGLLRARNQSSSHSTSIHQSLMWRRVFRDRDTYDLFFSICSLKTAGKTDQLGKRAKTIAQARLLVLLVELIDYEPIRSSQLPEIETKYGVTDGGLLKFAAVHMVDWKGDWVMHLTILEFFTNLLRTRSSAALDFLIENGLHDSTISYYTNDGDIRAELSTAVYPKAAEYIAVYCSNFEYHILENRHFLDRLIQCLHDVAEETASLPQPYKFPPHDLNVLASLPPAVLLPRNSRLTPLFALVPNTHDANIYKALAKIFRGTVGPNLQDQSRANGNSAVRALYFLYMKRFPLLWNTVCFSADVVALKELALAAIGLINAVISANWEPLPTELPESWSNWPTLPTEEELASECGLRSGDLPSSGFLTVLYTYSSQNVLEYLCSAGSNFKSLIGGNGDTESAAYQVAVAKYDVIRLFRQKLKDVVQARPDLQGVLTTLEQRLAEGATGGSSDVGGRIGILEL